jgi:DNA polymerase-3 subunit alpha
MEFIEPLGLLKMDFLAIKNLNTISNILKDINDNNFDINNIDLNDKNTLYLFKNAYTTGIFQFESNGMKSFLKELECDSFHTLIDAIALYRPGPREMIPEYIKNKKNPKNIKYLVKELEPILKSTYGIIIYQEQVLEILREIGGYSYSEADIIRRAMSKKKENIILENKDRFINGVINKGYTAKIGEELYNLIIKFSSYGFNKSHSVVYSVLAFQMAYLKINYTIFYMRNLLNMNKSSEMIKEYIDEAKLLGIEFENIDINKSSHEFIINNKKLVLPFTIIKSIAGVVSDEIVNERSNGSFKSFYDFMIRCYSKNINKRIVISLIECGAFDIFKVNKKQLIENIDEVVNYVTLCKDLNIVLDDRPVFEEIEDFNDKEIIDNEIKNYGFYLSFHPVTKYDRSLSITLNNIPKYFDRTINTILYVESIKTIKTKNNDKMSFVSLSDEYSNIEGVIFPETYRKLGEVNKNNVYKISGHIEKRNNTYQLIIYNMTLL